MRLVRKTEMLSDATMWLSVEDIPKGLSVKDAMSWIVKNNPSELGRIYIGSWLNCVLVAEYRDSEATIYTPQHNEEEVVAIEANGGWGRMNYYIKIK